MFESVVSVSETMVVNVIATLVLWSLVLLVTCWYWFKWTHRVLIREAAKVPSPQPTWPIIGHAHLSLQNLGELALDALAKGMKTYSFWCGPLPMIVLQDVQDIQVILNSTSTSDKADEFLYFTCGLESDVGPFLYNILSAQGTRWKVTRRHFNPMFHSSNVQHLLPSFNKNSRELLARMSRHEGKPHFNVLDYAMDVGLKTVCNLIFGPNVEFDVNSKSFRDIVHTVERIPEIFIKHVCLPWLRADSVFRLLYRKDVRKINNSLKNFTEAPLKMIKETSQRKTNTVIDNKTNTKEEDPAGKEPVNLLDAFSILQQNNPDFSEADLHCEMLNLFCTGTDTVAITISSCFLALAQYQDIQERLYCEVTSVVGPDDDVTVDDLAKMPYLEQVVKETLRRFVIVPFIMRKLLRDVQLKQCMLPAGSSVICSLVGVHMDPQLYPNPCKFDPERFSTENSEKREKFAFSPFAWGPRVCIAKIYAMQLLKIMVIHVLRKYKLRTKMDIHNLKKKLIVTSVSTEGYNISLEPRIASTQTMKI